jgi:hypothetical protein
LAMGHINRLEKISQEFCANSGDVIRSGLGIQFSITPMLSRIFTTRLPATFSNRCTGPLGQRISIASTLEAGVHSLPHPPGDASFLGDVREHAIAVVMVKGSSALGPLGSFESAAVGQENIRPAAIVEVKESGATGGGFDDVALGLVAAVFGLGSQASTFRDVDEINSGGEVSDGAGSDFAGTGRGCAAPAEVRSIHTRTAGANLRFMTPYDRRIRGRTILQPATAD